jgi:DNA repair exonuclease SbcCD ATPase subunit
MKLYGIKMHNFMRFGETDNSIVFNVTKDQKEKIQKGETTFDSLYKAIEDDPIKYVETVSVSSDNVLEGIVGIAGMTAGTFDSSNGSGKSTIFEAISYAFYDRVVRQTANTDKKAPAGLSVVTKLSGEYPKTLKESYVEVYFEEDERLYRLKRGRSFTKTKKSSSPILEFDCIKEKEVDKLSSHRKGDTKKSLEEVIVEDYDIFVNTVMFGQADAGKFLVGTDKVKKDMIIELLKLEDLVHGCMDVIRKKKKVENDKLNGLISSSDSLKGLVIKHHNKFNNDEIEYSDDLIDIVTTYIGNSLEEINKKKDELSKGLLEICSEIKDLEGSEILKSIEILIGDGKELVKQKKELVLSKEQNLKDWKSVLEESRSSLSVLGKEKLDLSNDLSSRSSKLEEIEGKVSKIDVSKLNQEVEEAQKIISLEPKHKERWNKIVKANETTIQKISEFNAIINLRNTDLRSLRKQIEEAGDSETFLCHECHSTVTKDHTLEKMLAIEKVIEDNSKLRESLREKKIKIDNASETTTSNLKAIEKKKEELRRNTDVILFYNDSDKVISDLKSEISNLKSRIDNKNKQIESKNKGIEELVVKCSSVEDTFKERFEDLEARVSSKREQVSKLKHKSSIIEVKISEKKKDKSKVEEEIASINNE